MARLPDLSGHALLGVFAHPDDESLACGGLLALCAEAGARTALLCFTRGEHGPDGESEAARPSEAGALGAGAEPADPERLGDVRAAELRAAAHVLGVGDVMLLQHEDGMLPWLDAERLEADVVAAIRRVDPDVVVTFDEDGLYGHPDHVAVHERVTAAVAALGPSAPALCYVSMPAGAMRGLLEAAGDGRSAASSSATSASNARQEPAKLLGVDVDAFGAAAPRPTLEIEVGAAAARRKLAALRCHRTQVAASALDRLEERAAARFLGTELYRRAPVGARGEMFIERLAAAAAASG